MLKKKLKNYMNENDLTQRELAGLMNLDETYLSKILNDRHEPGHTIIKKYYNLPGVKEKEDLEERLAKLEKQFEKLRGDNLMTKTITLKSNELKKTGEIGKDIYFWMLHQLEKWAYDNMNNVTHSDVDSFEKGNWLIEITIRENGISYSAGRTKQELNNEPEWAEDNWEDIGKEQFIKEFKEYL